MKTQRIFAVWLSPKWVQLRVCVKPPIMVTTKCVRRVPEVQRILTYEHGCYVTKEITTEIRLQMKTVYWRGGRSIGNIQLRVLSYLCKVYGTPDKLPKRTSMRMCIMVSRTLQTLLEDIKWRNQYIRGF
jgi:hypothetical protein